MRYQFIQAECRDYSIELLCRVLEVSRSGYYDWRGRPKSKRVTENQRLVKQIKAFHCGSRCTYGSPLSLVNRIQRSAYAIPTNIAEGCGRRTNADFKQFLHIALG